MAKAASSDSSCSGMVTIAYTENVPSTNTNGSSETTDSDVSSFSSSSLETPTSQESMTSLFEELDALQQTEMKFGYIPITSDPGRKMEALQYFKDHSVFQLFTFMMTHLLAHCPEDPVPFLVSLVERCIAYRDGEEDAQPPLVFEEDHIKSVYTALDPLDDGSITYRQYVNGMTTLGLTDFNLLPNEMDSHQRDIPKQVFLDEGKRALVAQLDKWLGKPISRQSTLSEESLDITFEESKGGLENYVVENHFTDIDQVSSKAGNGIKTNLNQTTSTKAVTSPEPLTFSKILEYSLSKASAKVFSKSNSVGNVS